MPRENNSKDRLYAEPVEKIQDFVFDQKVASVFQDMIRRSVPGYSTIISMTGLLARRFVQPGTICYDLGCSLGAGILSMLKCIDTDQCSIVGVDNSPAMIKQCRENTKFSSERIPVHLICADVNDIILGNASVAVLNFTLQFIPLVQRATLLKNIYEGMVPGGLLILSEKIKFEDQRTEKMHREMHHDFKRIHGYSDLEISQKRAALERVLLPETLNTHRKRLKEAGFSSISVWFQCFNFVSITALK